MDLLPRCKLPAAQARPPLQATAPATTAGRALVAGQVEQVEQGSPAGVRLSQAAHARNLHLPLAFICRRSTGVPACTGRGTRRHHPKPLYTTTARPGCTPATLGGLALLTVLARRIRLQQQVAQQLLPQRTILLMQLAALLAGRRGCHGRRAGVQQAVYTRGERWWGFKALTEHPGSWTCTIQLQSPQCAETQLPGPPVISNSSTTFSCRWPGASRASRGCSLHRECKRKIKAEAWRSHTDVPRTRQCRADPARRRQDQPRTCSRRRPARPARCARRHRLPAPARPLLPPQR